MWIGLIELYGMEKIEHKRNVKKVVKKIVTFDILSQDKKGKMGNSIINYIIFLVLIVPAMYYFLPRKIGYNYNTLLTVSLVILIWMISFFNIFVIYKKSKILFIIFYLFPIFGGIISLIFR